MDAGLDEATIDGVFTGTTDGFSDSQRAALALADALMTQPSSIGDATVEDLHRHFTEEQIIELTLDVMKWNAQKVAVALGTDTWIRPGELSDLRFDEQGDWVRPQFD
jgi:alkylhydroperoxidase family enzyme